MPRTPKRTLRPDEVAHKRACLDALDYVERARRECDDTIALTRVRRRELSVLSVKLSRFEVEDVEAALDMHKVAKRAVRFGGTASAVVRPESSLAVRLLGVMEIGKIMVMNDIIDQFPRLSRSGLRRAMDRLRKQGKVERVERGFYIRLPESQK